MSINLGNEAIDAVRKLRNSPEWGLVMAALTEQSRKSMNTALEAPPELKGDACGYARAIRDVFIALYSASTGTPMNRVEKPGVVDTAALDNVLSAPPPPVVAGRANVR